MNDKSLPRLQAFNQSVLRIFTTTALALTVSFHPAAQADHAGNAQDPENNSIMLTVTDEMTRIAQALLATMNRPSPIENAVGYQRRAELALDYGHEARRNWVYWPYLRKGLRLQFMTAQQRMLTHDLLNAALSSVGYLKSVQIMQMEQVLAETETIGFPRGTEDYSLAFFGEPSADQHWGWRFEGHHLSLNFAVAPGEVSVTPAFFGAAPARIESGALAGFRNLQGEHQLGRLLVQALNAEQRTIAVQADSPPFDIVSGTLNKPPQTHDDWKSLPEIGIAIAELSRRQKQIAQRIVNEVIGAYRPELSRAYLQRVDINELRFSWFGSVDEEGPHYYRLDGPDFFFEYDLVQNNGNHVHTVWRSKHGDFGADLLLQHHQEAH